MYAMETFKTKLDNLIEDALTKMRALINNKGEESEHSCNQCLKIKDNKFMYNLEDGRYLSEITENLI